MAIQESSAPMTNNHKTKKANKSVQGGPNTTKNKKKKEEKEGPRRALSAYNLFFQQERVVLLESLPVRASGKPRRSHGKLPFAAMARIIGARWKAITPERKAYFDDLALKDKLRYNQELKEFKQQKEQQARLHPLQPQLQQQLQQQQDLVLDRPPHMIEFPQVPLMPHSAPSFYSTIMMMPQDVNKPGVMMMEQVTQQPVSLETIFASNHQDDALQTAPVKAFDEDLPVPQPPPAVNYYNSPTTVQEEALCCYNYHTTVNNDPFHNDELMPFNCNYYQARDNHTATSMKPPTIADLAQKLSRDEMNCVIGAFL